MKVVLVTVGLLALGIAGMAIKILGKKDGEFAGTCASQSPYLNKEGESCTVCGASSADQCKNSDQSAIS
jgi:hypothetical protein